MKWEKVRLDEICEVLGGTTPSTSKRKYWDGNIVWLSPVDLPEVGTITKVNTSRRKLTTIGLKESGLKLLPKGSLVFSTRASIGKIGLTECPLVTNQGFTSLIPSCAIDVHYLAYALKYYTPQIEKKGNSTTFKEVSRSVIKSFEIPLPPIQDQKKIVDTLNKADALRQKDQQLLQKYDELAYSIFYEMFGDPVKNKFNWDVRVLADLYNKKKDGTKCGPFGSALKKSEYTSSGVPVWVMDNIVNDKFSHSDCLFIPSAKFKELQAYSVSNGDIIISRAGTVGKMCVVNSSFEKSIISTNLIRLSLNNDLIVPDYFIKLMKYFGPSIGRLKKGADGSFSHMNTGILNSLQFPLPPLKLQERYLSILNNIAVQKGKIMNENSKKLFEILLNKYSTN